MMATPVALSAAKVTPAGNPAATPAAAPAVVRRKSRRLRFKLINYRLGKSVVDCRSRSRAAPSKGMTMTLLP